MDGFINTVCFDLIYHSNQGSFTAALLRMGWGSDIQYCLSDILWLTPDLFQKKRLNKSKIKKNG